MAPFELFDLIRFMRHSTRYLDHPVPLKEQNSRVADLPILESATTMPFELPKLWRQHFYGWERERWGAACAIWILFSRFRSIRIESEKSLFRFVNGLDAVRVDVGSW